ncbi:glutamate receptor ionotropic, delta-1-like [Penaeus japonicus]|uniref:glutamate receptor ionotropic, delta-1-like n=1 Tax=Penaeus japonicus TaxID=27405 RepID=UPI001C7123ED|nr:glutamate receptor ionotropic, delta-1-like [Penaeus japonicus]
MAPFFVTPQRESVCDFSVPVYTDSQAILMVRPTVESDVSGFIKPFTSEVWLLIFLSIFSIGVAMIGIESAEGKIFNFSTPSLGSKAFMWVVQALSQESSEWLPVKDGGRLLVTTWLLASLVFMSSYSGILTAMLTVPRVTIPIDSLADLVTQDELPWRLEAGSMMYSFFEESENEMGQKVFNDKAGTFQDCWAARENIANGEFAAICDSTTMMKAMSWDFSTTGDCHLYIARQKVYTNGLLAIAFRNKSAYLPHANRIITTLKEAGIIDKWLRDQMTNTSQCLRPPSADRSEGIAALDLQSFYGPIMVLAGGAVLGAILIVLEIILHSLSK